VVLRPDQARRCRRRKKANVHHKKFWLMRASGCNQKTTVIMITGTDDPYVVRRGIQAEANFLLFKPVNNERLLNLSRIAQSAASARGAAFSVWRSPAMFK
jgi:AmiR/NasT family two-component response regulator